MRRRARESNFYYLFVPHLESIFIKETSLRVIIAFVCYLLYATRCVHYFTSHCVAFQTRLCLILLHDGGPSDKLLGPYWNLLLNLFVSRVIVATLLFAFYIRSLVQSESSCVSSQWLNTRSRDSSDSNELLPLKMQKHFTLLFFLMHTQTDLRSV